MRIWMILLALALLLTAVGCPADDDDDSGDDDASADDDATGDDDDATGDDDDATPDDDDATADDDDATTDDDDATPDDDDDATGGVPHLVVYPTELDFGVLCIAQPDQIALRLINSGNGPLIVAGMNTTVPPVSFTEFVGPIGPGDEEVVWITAGCPNENEYTGEVRIYSDDVANPSLAVPVFLSCDEC